MAAFKAGRLVPRHKEPPAVVAVHVDAGKVQLRADDGAPGVRDPRWADAKVACCVTYPTKEDDADPEPEPPAAFLDPPMVARLCHEFAKVRNLPATPAPAPLGPTAAVDEAEDGGPRRTAKPRVRTAVATLGNTEEFGWLAATEAQRRGFYHAVRRAFVGDGGNWIVPLGAMHFPDWIQVLDFLHLLGHLYAAATSAWPSQPGRAWKLYEKLLRAAWGGRVGDVLTEIDRHRDRLGPAPRDAPDDDPRLRLKRVSNYVRENAGRMDYPRYRRQGLPVTSTLVESLIKQFNQRMKGTEKFWIGGGAEALLQVRAAYLSEDDRADELFARRRLPRAAGRARLGAAA